MENISGHIFVGFFVIAMLSYCLMLYRNRKERDLSRLNKDLSDAEYEEQQKIHDGDLTSLKEEKQ